MVTYILSLSVIDVLLTKNSTARGCVVLGLTSSSFNVACDCVTMLAVTENIESEVGITNECLVSLRSFCRPHHRLSKIYKAFSWGLAESKNKLHLAILVMVMMSLLKILGCLL